MDLPQGGSLPEDNTNYQKETLPPGVFKIPDTTIDQMSDLML